MLGFSSMSIQVFCGVRGEECGAEVHAGRGRNVRAKDERGPADASQRTLSGSVGISRPRGQDRAVQVFCGVRGEECGAEVHAGRGRNVRAKDERGPADASQRTLSGSVGISRPRGQDRAGLGRQSSSCTISGCSQTRMRGRSCRASSRRRCRDAARSPAPCRRSIRPCQA